MGKLRDLTGERFGALTAIKLLPKREGMRDRPRWLCKCDCGNTIEVYSDNLLHGRKSCGCIKRGPHNCDLPISKLPEDIGDGKNTAIVAKLKPKWYC